MNRRLTVDLAGHLLFTIMLISYPNAASGATTANDSHIPFKSNQESNADDLSTKPGVDSLNISRLDNQHPKIRNGTIKQYHACPIPQLEPYHESIIKYVNNTELPVTYNCTGHYQLLFNSTLQSTIIPAKGPDYFLEEGYESCCYRTVWRQGAAGGGNETMSSKCFPVNLAAETIIPNRHEFIAIFCKINGSKEERLVDVHSFIHLKPSSSLNNSKESRRKFNIIIFGLDGVSRMHFIRAMPLSYSFLRNELDAVEMFGYNKVGGQFYNVRPPLKWFNLENSPPNIMPMLIRGLPRRDSAFDTLPFIWKDYSKHGYSTMFSEDDSSTFFHDMGLSFYEKPTNYYLRPFSHFADGKFKTEGCYGPRLTVQVLLDHMEKYVDTMNRNKKNFFGLTWSSGLTHSHINTARLGDPHLLKSLQWLKESGHLNNTIFILMSDHGNRLDDIVNTIQGQLETRLPLLHIVLPKSFKVKYHLAYSNLLSNADKLITTYDLHESLKEILHLDMIKNRKLLKRKVDLVHLGRSLPRGISLFLPIPGFRTCEMARIDKNFCSCTYMEVANVSDPEIDAAEKADIVISQINSILYRSNGNCSVLELQNVSMVSRVGYPTDFFWSGYKINLETKPGGGQFEALVVKVSEEDDWEVRGPIVRSDLYGNQSQCVQDIDLKPYCYCMH